MRDHTQPEDTSKDKDIKGSSGQNLKCLFDSFSLLVSRWHFYDSGSGVLCIFNRKDIVHWAKKKIPYKAMTYWNLPTQKIIFLAQWVSEITMN